MRKQILIMLLTSLCIFATTACTKTQGDRQKEQDLTDVKIKEDTQIDTERYQAYIKVLSEIVEKQQWPDVSSVPEAAWGIPFGSNQFAICDVDKDGNEELLVEINDAAITEMQTRVFDYDKDSKQVVEQWSGLPGCTYYENGVVYVEDLHNQTPGVTIRPFYLYQHDSKQDTFEYVGSAYCQERGATADVFPEAEDLDGDGVIYYILDSNHEEKPSTKEEYETWLNSYLRDADEVYVPYEDFTIDNVDLIRHCVETEGAVRGINLLPEKVISEYDITGDGKKDSILIHCVKENKDFPGYGIQWNISINNQIVHEIKDEWGTKPEIRLYSVSDKRSYLSVGQYCINNGDIADFALYQTKSEQLERVCNFYSDFLNPAHVFHYEVQLQVLTKDKLILLCSNQFNATAHMSWEMKFEYKDNKWTLSETEYPIVYEPYQDNKRDGMTANQDFVVYKTIICDEEAFIIGKGEIVTIDRLSIKDGRVCFRVTNSLGKEGWIPDPEEQYYEMNGEWLEGYFEEAMFAG